MPIDTTGTLLEISSMGVPLYSARGLSQTLKMIDALVAPRRTINGQLINVSFVQFRKYASKITCKDQRAPGIDGFWKGMLVTVSCVQELAYVAGGTAQRIAVDGSERTEGNFTFYRPLLDMMITDISTQDDEWAADVQWELNLEEV